MRVGLRDRRRQREVDDADVELALVVDGELQPVDRVENRPVAGVVGSLDRDQVRLRCHPDVVADKWIFDPAATAVARDDARDVRAVAVGVGGRRGVRIGHHRRDHARLPVRAREVRQRPVDARVDDRDTDLLAGRDRPHVRREDGGDVRRRQTRAVDAVGGRPLGQRAGRRVGTDRLDPRVARQPRTGRGREPNGEPADDREVAHHPAVRRTNDRSPLGESNAVAQLHDVRGGPRVGVRRPGERAENSESGQQQERGPDGSSHASDRNPKEALRRRRSVSRLGRCVP